MRSLRLRIAMLLVTATKPRLQSKDAWSNCWSGSPKKYWVWKADKQGRMFLNKKEQPVLVGLPKYMYHGTTLKSAQKLLKTGTAAGRGFDLSANPNYSKSYCSSNDGTVALLRVATQSIDLKRVEMSDNWDDLDNIRIHQALPASAFALVSTAK